MMEEQSKIKRKKFRKLLERLVRARLIVKVK